MTAADPAVPRAADVDPARETARFDVVTLGESMVTFLPSRPGRLADVPSFDRGIGGAESNVACGLAAAGHRVAWVSRVGADGFGEHLVEAIAAYGVDTGAVERDPDRPTGVYFRTAGERVLGPPDAAAGGAEGGAAGGAAHRTGSGGSAGAFSEVVYHRAGSAASAMSCANMPADLLRSGRILHLSGITAALSADCRALLHALTAPAADHEAPADRAGTRRRRPLCSFDVNHRVGLWRRDGDDPGTVLRALARRCDLVFVGEDEAHALWGVTGGPAAVRAVLPEPRVLVVKQGATGVTVLHRAAHAEGRPAGQLDQPDDTVTSVPALHVDVVAPVGAGDAFAAGFLSATLRGLPVRDRVRHGHLMAAAVLTAPGDLVAPPARGHADRLAGLDDRAWAALHLAPGWTEPPRAPSGTPPRDPARGTVQGGPAGPRSGPEKEARAS